MRFRLIFVFILLLLLGYLLFYPVPFQPVSWQTYDNPGFTGPFQTNQALASAEYLFEGQCYKCEDVDVDEQGRIYGASEDGHIYRFTQGQRDTFAFTGGRPLGMHFDSLGYLLVADAQKGLLRISPSGQITSLASGYEDYTFRFADDLDISPDGKIYFTDASNRFSIDQYKFDLLEHQRF